MSKRSKNAKPVQLALPGFEPRQPKAWSVAGLSDGLATVYPVEHQCWSNMIQRCYYPLHKGFQYYGGKGVNVCPEWRRSFAAFVRDMGPRPDGCSIDRIDPSGDYEPANCRWLDAVENTRRARQKYCPVYTAANKAIAEDFAQNPGLHKRMWDGWCRSCAVRVPLSDVDAVRPGPDQCAKCSQPDPEEWDPF